MDDLISRKTLLEAYDRAHQGPPGGARKLIEEAPEAVVRCKDCRHRPKQTDPPKAYGFSIEFPEGSKCPCQCDDGFYSWHPGDDWFCANGERT